MTPPAAAPAVRARPLAPRRALTPSPRPRRVSGPARPATRPSERFSRPERAAAGGLALGVASLARAVTSHRLLDRLIRGRAWIVLIAFALIGIVTLQLALLKLNAGIGRSLERGALLQRENATLSIENSELADGSRVEAAAEHLGMSLVPPGLLKFLHAGAGNGNGSARAAAALSAPAHGTGEATPAGAEPSSASSSLAATASAPASESSTEASSSSASSSAGHETPSSSSGGEAAAAGAGSGSAAAGAQPGGEAHSGGGAAPSESSSQPAAASPGAAEAGAGGGTQAAPGG